MMVMIEFVVLMAILLYALYQIFRILYEMAGNYFRVAKLCPGAREAYEMLRQSAQQGEVPDEVLEQAAALMRVKGASADEAFGFLCRCCALTQEDIVKIRRAVEQTEQKICMLNELRDSLNESEE